MLGCHVYVDNQLMCIIEGQCHLWICLSKEMKIMGYGENYINDEVLL